MSVDYRAPKKQKPWPLIIAVVGLGGLALGMGGVWLLKAPERAAHSKVWRLDGPPCPTITAEAFAARHMTAKMTTDYEEVIFARAAGHVSCDLDSGAKVCQFTSPIVVVVTPPGKPTTYFEPGVGHPATVAVQDGKASCVMASNFKV
jgi:hypothetical protein